MSLFAGMRWDLWELAGLFGEGLFFARMIAQWTASEKVGKPVIPIVYWHLSLVGAVILVAYAFHIGSFAVLIPQAVGLVFYVRGLQLERRSRRREARRAALGLDDPGHVWPSLSVVVPVHNEERILAAALASLVAQRYPGGDVEIIVALNGCADASRAEAGRFPVRIVEDSRAGMSFGKNIGGRAAGGELLVFVDADTRLPPDALRLIAEAAADGERRIGTVAGRPERGGPVVKACFAIANLLTRFRKAHAPGGVLFMNRAVFEVVGGFDESLPQGTSTDCVWRALSAGADYAFIDSFRAETSIRRFEKTGIIRQMLDWRRNHRALKSRRRGEVEGKGYENIR